MPVIRRKFEKNLMNRFIEELKSGYFEQKMTYLLNF